MHSHGSPPPPSNGTFVPEGMQFTAYITRNELEGGVQKYDSPIARIAQIFASDVMPFHCKNYAERCAKSGVEPDLVTVIPRPASSRNLIPPAMSTSYQYRFHGYHPGILESFLLHLSSSTNSIPHSLSVGLAHPGIPHPALVDKSINRIHEASLAKKLIAVSAAAPGSPSTYFTSTIIPAFPTPAHPEAGAVTSNKKGKAKQDVKQTKQKVMMDAKKKEQKATVEIAGNERQMKSTEQTPRPIAQPLPHSPVSPTPHRPLYPSLSQPPQPEKSPVSVSTASTFDWKSQDESIFQGDLDPSSSTSITRLQCSLSSITTGPALVPIISMGPATEVALEQAGLVDSFHTQLRKLVSTRRDTAWLSCLRAAPFSFAPSVATAIHAAVLVDVRNSD